MVPFSHSKWLWFELFPLCSRCPSQTSLWQPAVLRGRIGFPESVRPALPVSPTVKHGSWLITVLFEPSQTVMIETLYNYPCVAKRVFVSLVHEVHAFVPFDWFWFYSASLCVCSRMLRGASMMQDFPILTWTNNLESLWVNLDFDANICSSSCFLCDSLDFSPPGRCREPRSPPSPLICARISSCSGRCETLCLSHHLQ